MTSEKPEPHPDGIFDAIATLEHIRDDANYRVEALRALLATARTATPTSDPLLSADREREGEDVVSAVMELTPDPRRDALVNWFADLNDGMRSISSGRFAAGEPERNADSVLALLAAPSSPETTSAGVLDEAALAFMEHVQAQGCDHAESKAGSHTGCPQVLALAAALGRSGSGGGRG